MSKRAGNIVTMDDLVDAVGVDAARYALARSSADSQIDIDLDLLTQATNDNPVYYVQYAHARTAAMTWRQRRRRSASDAGRLRPRAARPTRREGELLAALGEFPRVVASGRRAARAAPGRPLPRGRWPAIFHRWYDACRVLPESADEPGDRPAPHPALAQPGHPVRSLANGLGLLGVSARSGCRRCAIAPEAGCAHA